MEHYVFAYFPMRDNSLAGGIGCIWQSSEGGWIVRHWWVSLANECVVNAWWLGADRQVCLYSEHVYAISDVCYSSGSITRAFRLWVPPWLQLCQFFFWSSLQAFSRHYPSLSTGQLWTLRSGRPVSATQPRVVRKPRFQIIYLSKAAACVSEQPLEWLITVRVEPTLEFARD